VPAPRRRPRPRPRGIRNRRNHISANVSQDRSPFAVISSLKETELRTLPRLGPVVRPSGP